MTGERHDHTGDNDDAVPADAGQLGTTQRRLLLLLCQGERTVNELAAELGVTDNAVRAQLQRLTRDGLVRQVGSRPGIRRPHAQYELSPDAAKVFPTAYAPAMRFLVDVLSEQLPTANLRKLLLEAGRRLLRSRFGDLRGQGAQGRLAEILERIGGAACGAEVIDRPDETVVRSCACPLAAVTSSHPETCGLVAELLAEVIEAPVRELCTKGEAPRCAFVITLPT
jgi:predicted ArsR family transcriptional regulator